MRGLSSVLREGAPGQCEDRGHDTPPPPPQWSPTRVLTTLLHRQLGPAPDSVRGRGRGRGEKVLTQFLYVDITPYLQSTYCVPDPGYTVRMPR